MGIWLDELEQAVQAEARRTLRDRRALRMALADRHVVVHEAGGADAALLLVDALPRPSVKAEAAEAQMLLRSELVQQPYEAIELRNGQSGLLLPGPVDAEQVKRLLTRLNRRLQVAGQGRHLLVFGAARASEARRSPSSWLALADLRLQMRPEPSGPAGAGGEGGAGAAAHRPALSQGRPAPA